MRRGAFITVEGAEGVGKSTSLAAIERHLRARGIDLLLTREPGGTELGEQVRRWILDGDHGALSANVEALLMFAARSQHLDTRIRPALEAGTWVICDRFTDATLAYQGGGRGASARFLSCLATEVQRGLTPDLTLLLDAPVEVGLGRIANRSHDHFEREDHDFFERVRASYLQIAAAEPGRVRLVDASAAVDAVERQIIAQLEAFCVSYDGGGAEA
jgi:dTMP kinase